MSHGTPVPFTAKPSSGLNGTVRLPGDKSISHRSLILSTLCVGESKVNGLLMSEDILATKSAMEALGATIDIRDDQVTIQGVGNGGLLEPDRALDFGNAGTGSRLTMGLVASYDFASTFVGDASLSARPMGRILDPLRDLGAQVIARSRDRLPLTIKGSSHAAAMRYAVPVPSAQVKSAILLAGLNCKGTTTVIERVATRDHSEKMLEAFGADINVSTLDNQGGAEISVVGETDLRAQHVDVPGDPSSAGFLLVAALICPNSSLTIENCLLNPTRTGLITTLKEMGADISIVNERVAAGERVGDLVVNHSELKGVTVPAERAPSMIDEYPILAVAAAYAKGKTLMQGVEELRIKETDRLEAVAKGLIANGVEVENGQDWMAVIGQGSVTGGATIATELDHRIAMSFLILGLGAENPILVDDGTVMDTSFPNFAAIMRDRGAEIVAS